VDEVKHFHCSLKDTYVPLGKDLAGGSQFFFEKVADLGAVGDLVAKI
jgi:hypothetical protein